MTTYYVDGIFGNDTNNGLSPNNAWGTFQKGVDNASVAGDVVRVMGIFALSTSINLTHSGAPGNPIIFEGADQNGNPATDGYVPIDGSLLSGGASCITISGFSDIEFRRIEFANASGNGISQVTSGIDARFIFKSCRFGNNVGNGVVAFTGSSASSRNWHFIDCDFDHNGNTGITGQSSNRLPAIFIGCKFYNNGSYGIKISGDGSMFFHCQAYKNGDDGFFVNSSTDSTVFVNCISYSNTNDGFNIKALAGLTTILNCSSSSNTGFGFNLGGSIGGLVYMDFNHTFNNTLGVSDVTLPGTNVTGDPLFTNILVNQEDFTPKVGSPLHISGKNGFDIGALRSDLVEAPSINASPYIGVIH